MIEFYVKQIDQERVLQAIRDNVQITIIGLAKNGKLETFTGCLRTLQLGQTAFEGYPIRVAMLPSSINPLIPANSN